MSFDNWVYVCYYKTPLILEILRQHIGISNFLSTLKHYFELYKFSLATFSDLQESFESVVGESLSWFFLPWFNNLYLPKYSFKSHSFDSSTNELVFTIEYRNEPYNQYKYYQEVPFLIYDIDNQVIDSPALPSYLAINGTTTFNFTLPKTPLKVELLYYNYELVQLNDLSDLTLTLIVTPPFIPGYNIGLFLITTLLTIGIIFVIRKKEEF